jgi:AcrR family transcriptional regulator
MAVESSRDRILRSAISLMAARGYHETSVGDIEAAAGLTRRAGGFYRHFASKEAVLIQAVEGMADEMVDQISLKEIAALQSIRAELLLIARALLRHAEAHRPARLILQRDGHQLPKLRAAARRANARLASVDVLPWIKSALSRSGAKSRRPRELGLLIFGPVLLYIISVDRADPAFGLADTSFLKAWASHWSAWFARGGRD